MNLEKPTRSTRSVALPAAGAAIVGAGLVAFLLGRGTAPPSSNATPAAKSTHQKENGHEGGGEENSEGEKTGDEHGTEEIKFDGDATQTAGVRVAPVAFRAETSGIAFNGQIAPNPNGVVRVASVVPGRVTRLFVSVGDNVRQGQTLAIVESRAVGEAQSAYQQAAARLQNARSNYNVVLQQARAGVFSRAPLETARRAQVEAQADVRAQEVALRQAQIALENARRLAQSGSFASPALEAARAQSARAVEAYRSAQAALSNGEASVRSAQNELARRRQIASSGGYASRPVEEARRVLVAAQSARAAATSEVSTTRINLNRARSLTAEGLVSQRDLETAQQAYETATARLETAQADESAASRELERQQKLASSNAAETAEVSAAQSQLASARADVRTRRAEVARAREEVGLGNLALSRERANFRGNIANRREISPVEAGYSSTRNALLKARQTLSVVNAAYEREARIYNQNLNNIAQVQGARSTLVQAQSDLTAAQTALRLLKSAPGGHASVPIVAPISGVVQEREIAQGEVLDADAQLMTLVNLNTVVLEVAVTERDMARVRAGSLVKVRVDGVPNREFAGRISTLGTQLNRDTRTLTARAFLRNDGTLRPGMFARGQIVTRSGGSRVLVPAEAVQGMEGKKVVFVPADEPNTFVARKVEIGDTQSGQTVITNGLKPGERIVVKGAFMVKAQAMKAELGHGD